MVIPIYPSNEGFVWYNLKKILISGVWFFHGVCKQPSFGRKSSSKEHKDFNLLWKKKTLLKDPSGIKTGAKRTYDENWRRDFVNTQSQYLRFHPNPRFE